MKEKRTSNLVIVLVIILVALLIIAAGLFFLVTNEIVEGKIYPKNVQVLNLRGREVTVEHYEKVRAKFPNAEIYWNIPIGDSRYPEDTVEQISDACGFESSAYFRRVFKRYAGVSPREYRSVSSEI